MDATWIVRMVALACVCGIAAGQLLFKLGGDMLTRNGGQILSAAGGVLVGALALYGVTTLASHFLLGEQFSWRYGLGCLLVVAGIVLTSRG